MIFVPYSEMTQEEKDIQQSIWEEVLNDYCITDDMGCRPCDMGCPCDKCHYD